MELIKIIILGILLIGAIGCGNKKKDRNFSYFQNYQRTFNDMNDKHLGAARRWGIKPVAEESDLRKLKGKLTEIKSCRHYELDDLTHSLPFLVPRAAGLLETIGRNFRDSLDSKGLSSCKIVVTSVLRTPESVKKLRRKNTNASSNSAHVYGATFDIAYARYKGGDKGDNDKLKSVLAEVLQELRVAKKCYIRYEYRQGCFHITAR